MDERSFNKLIKSVREAGAIMRGEKAPSRKFTMSPPRVRRIREMTSLSQMLFAQFLNISPGTLQNWEQGRREPTGPAKALLNALENDPENVLKALHPEIMGNEKRRAQKAPVKKTRRKRQA